MELKELADHAMKRAKKISKAGQQVMACFMLWSPEGDEGKLIVMGMPEYAENRQLSLIIVKSAIEFHKCDRFAFVCEAWMAKATTEEGRKKLGEPGFRASKAPDRIEVIVVHAANKTGDKVIRVTEIKRQGKKVTFADDPFPDTGQMMTLMDNMFGTEKVN